MCLVDALREAIKERDQKIAELKKLGKDGHTAASARSAVTRDTEKDSTRVEFSAAPFRGPESSLSEREPFRGVPTGRVWGHSHTHTHRSSRTSSSSSALWLAQAEARSMSPSGITREESGRGAQDFDFGRSVQQHRSVSSHEDVRGGVRSGGNLSPDERETLERRAVIVSPPGRLTDASAMKDLQTRSAAPRAAVGNWSDCFEYSLGGAAAGTAVQQTSLPLDRDISGRAFAFGDKGFKVLVESKHELEARSVSPASALEGRSHALGAVGMLDGDSFPINESNFLASQLLAAPRSVARPSDAAQRDVGEEYQRYYPTELQLGKRYFATGEQLGLQIANDQGNGNDDAKQVHATSLHAAQQCLSAGVQQTTEERSAELRASRRHFQKSEPLTGIQPDAQKWFVEQRHTLQQNPISEEIKARIQYAGAWRGVREGKHGHSRNYLGFDSSATMSNTVHHGQAHAEYDSRTLDTSASTSRGTSEQGQVCMLSYTHTT